MVCGPILETHQWPPTPEQDYSAWPIRRDMIKVGVMVILGLRFQREVVSRRMVAFCPCSAIEFFVVISFVVATDVCWP